MTEDIDHGVTAVMRSRVALSRSGDTVRPTETPSAGKENERDDRYRHTAQDGVGRSGVAPRTGAASAAGATPLATRRCQRTRRPWLRIWSTPQTPSPTWGVGLLTALTARANTPRPRARLCVSGSRRLDGMEGCPPMASRGFESHLISLCCEHISRTTGEMVVVGADHAGGRAPEDLPTSAGEESVGRSQSVG